MTRIKANHRLNLLKHIQENNAGEIERLILGNERLISEICEEFDYKTVLHFACQNLSEQVTGSTVRALINFGADVNFADVTGYRAIHFATLGLNPEVLQVIVDYTENVNSVTSPGDTALHLLIRLGDAEDAHFLECMEILIDNGVDCNIFNNMLRTPIQLAVERKYLHAVELLLKYDGIDVDTCIRLQDKYFNLSGVSARELIEELSVNTDAVPVNEVNMQLCTFLNIKDEDNFLRTIPQQDNYNSFKCYVTKACYENYFQVIKHFLDNKYSGNIGGHLYIESPFDVAMLYGLHDSIKTILQVSSSFNEISVNMLITLLNNLDYAHTNRSEYKKCFETLMECKNVVFDPNGVTTTGIYLLQHCSLIGHQGAAVSLLKHKASLANVDDDGIITIAVIKYDVLKEHFDYCIQPCVDYFSREDIVFDYRTLFPSDRSGKLAPEIRAVLHMSKSPELKPLLNHPLISSFLTLKWRQIRWFCYGNLLLYFCFCLTLFFYMTLSYNTHDNENTEATYAVCLLITNVMLLIRETVQLLTNPRTYFTNFENYIEVALISIVFATLLDPTPNDRTKYQISAVVILLSAFGLLFLLGDYPYFSITIAMFRKVSYEYFKFLVFYSIIIVSFGLSFYTLFKQERSTVGDEDLFYNPFISTFKTFVMLTGEFELGQLRFEQYSTTSHVVFVAFVFSNAIVLLNLLNGLAISDVQKIKNDAELYELAARTEYIAYLENIVFSDWNCKLLPNKAGVLFRKYILLPLAGKICLYPNHLKTYQLKVVMDTDNRHYTSTNYIDKEIVRKAKVINDDNKKKRQSSSEKVNCHEELLSTIRNYEAKIQLLELQSRKDAATIWNLKCQVESVQGKFNQTKMDSLQKEMKKQRALNKFLYKRFKNNKFS